MYFVFYLNIDRRLTLVCYGRLQKAKTYIWNRARQSDLWATTIGQIRSPGKSVGSLVAKSGWPFCWLLLWAFDLWNGINIFNCLTSCMPLFINILTLAFNFCLFCIVFLCHRRRVTNIFIKMPIRLEQRSKRKFGQRGRETGKQVSDMISGNSIYSTCSSLLAFQVNIKGSTRNSANINSDLRDWTRCSNQASKMSAYLEL